MSRIRNLIRCYHWNRQHQNLALTSIHNTWKWARHWRHNQTPPPWN